MGLLSKLCTVEAHVHENSQCIEELMCALHVKIGKAIGSVTSFQKSGRSTYICIYIYVLMSCGNSG